MLGLVLNTHQQWLCERFRDLGFTVNLQVTVSDEGLAIQNAVREAMPRAELIVCTGGLGPTSDDVTRDLVAELLGLKLVEDPVIVEHIASFFKARHRQLPSSTRIQAMVPVGATVLHNAYGTAPGLAVATPKGWLIMLPGPPRELRPMFNEQVVPRLEAWFPSREPFVCRVLKTTGLGESLVEERIASHIAPLLAQGLSVGYCARTGEVDLRFTARGANAATLVDQAVQVAAPLLGDYFFAEGYESLDRVIVDLLTAQQKTMALAESCTGGYVANRITGIPGSSLVFRGGVVSYSNDSKVEMLGVKSETLATHGAVSAETAVEMAEGARLKLKADFALSITGIAGPGGGTPEKPVGMVYVAMASEGGTQVRRFLNAFDRETFKYYTSQQALDMLRRKLTGKPWRD